MHRIVALIALALFALVPRPASASKCVQRSFDQLFAAADLVFVGRAESIDAELATTFNVERVFKGKAAKRIVIETDRNKYAAMDPPDRYLVLVKFDVDPSGKRRALATPCDGSKRLTDANDPDLASLGAGYAPDSDPPSELPDAATTPAPSAEEPAGPSPNVVRPAPPPPPPRPVEHSGCAACRVAPPTQKNRTSDKLWWFGVAAAFGLRRARVQPFPLRFRC